MKHTSDVNILDSDADLDCPEINISSKPIDALEDAEEVQISQKIKKGGNRGYRRNRKNETMGKGENGTVKKRKKKTINLNQYAVFLHILGDTLGSVAVIISSLAIKYWTWIGRFYLDPLVSLIMVITISIGAIRLLKKCVVILLHQCPMEINSKQLLTTIQQIPGVIQIHEFHIWSLNNNIRIASLHVQLTPEMKGQSDSVLEKIKNILHQSGIHVSTIQPEWEETCLDPRCADECQAARCCS